MLTFPFSQVLGRAQWPGWTVKLRVREMLMPRPAWTDSQKPTEKFALTV